MKISQIASEVGLETPHYFSRIFKKEYNMLPSAYMHFVRKVKAQQVLNSYGLGFMIEKEGINNRSITNELPGFAAGEGTEGIQKITLAPGSSSTVLLNINVNSVAYFDDERSKWVTAPGEYKIMAVSSSKDIRQVATFKVD